MEASSIHILVVYASKYGATMEIADKIGEILRNLKYQVKIEEAREDLDLSVYQAVVLGSAVYMGQWRKNAKNFLKRHQQTLQALPFWIFSSGPTGEGDALELTKGWKYPSNIKPLIDQIQPKEVKVFHGCLHAEKLNLFDRWIIRNAKSPLGDFRDWHDINKWAQSISSNLEHSLEKTGSG